ncbi:MAG: HlyD family efflux transporter periplasmic adaptor subunit [Phycisphaerae bacterium]|nr:HlyD family efflux transporter periplasmic adaptor subunit [Phycisphaerae bacterium]
MNKWLLLLVFLLIGGFGWYYVRTNVRMPAPWQQPKFGDVTRGDIRVPITASGLIRPNQDIEIKPEASGRVIEIPVVAGRYVKQGDPLVKLDPEDEQRSVDRAQTDVDRLRLQVRQAANAIETAKANVAIANAAIIEAEATLEVRKADYENIEKRAGLGGSSPFEVITAKSQVTIAAASLDRAKQQLISQTVAVADAENNKQIQEQLLKSAETTLGDAKERLEETTIRAPQDGIVATIKIEVGNVVQSGTQSLTGGTVVATVADVAKKIVIARVDESDYGRVLDISPVDSMPEMPGLREAAEAEAERLKSRTGDVLLNVDAFTEKRFKGRILRVEPQGKLNVGSSIIQYDVYVEVTDPEAYKLPLGSQAQVEFTVESASGVMRVPSEAVKAESGQKGVWVKTPPPPGSADQAGKRFVPCQFGITDGEFTEIVRTLGDEKLTEADKVYTKLPPEEDGDDD